MLEQQISQWREYLRTRQAIHTVDIAELEDHLREHIAALTGAGLAEDEAFLVAVKRLGNLDALSREFGREHSDRLWKQLVLPAEPEAVAGGARLDAMVAVGLAVLAAILIKLPPLFGLSIAGHESFYMRNVGLFVLPIVAGYFVWKRQAEARTLPWLVGAFVVAGIFANVYPFATEGSTEILAVLHAPLALWLVVGVAYAGDRWRQVAGRMDFIRFSGEAFIYYVLMALGGGVLMGFTFGIFQAIGIDMEPVFQTWILPCGAIGAVVIAAFLVEWKQGVIENIAPVLARIFTPLFTILLLIFLGAIAATGRGIDVEREVLIMFDGLLVVVLGLLLYSISARDPQAPAGPFDVLQLVLILSALAADVVALSAIVGRITEMGYTPNRVAGLGVNVILLVNLAWAAVLSYRFVRGRGTFAAIERWQTNYLPVYAAWAAIVVIAFPPLFGYL